MAINPQILDVDSAEPFYDLIATLSGVEYRFELQWNVNNEYWGISLYTSDNTPIFQGRKITTNSNVFAYCSSPLLPPGKLYAVDTSESTAEPEYEDLGVRILLIYTEDETL